MSQSKLEEYFRVYDKGEVIFREGKRGDSVFLIKSGSVDVVKESGPEKRVITSLSDGEIVGEMALRKGEHERTATVLTSSEVEGWRFPGPAFESLINQDENFRKRLFQSLVDRLIQTTNLLHEQESSEIQDLSLLLIKSARGLLPYFNDRELENGSKEKQLRIENNKEFLCYHFGVSPELLEAFRSLDGANNLDDLSDEKRIDLSELAQSMVRETTEQLRFDYAWDGEVDTELVNALRTARDHLDELEDHTIEMSQSELQGIMEVRNELTEVLEDRKQEGRNDFVINLLEKLLQGIKQELNIRYD